MSFHTEHFSSSLLFPFTLLGDTAGSGILQFAGGQDLARQGAGHEVEKKLRKALKEVVENFHNFITIQIDSQFVFLE